VESTNGERRSRNEDCSTETIVRCSVKEGEGMIERRKVDITKQEAVDEI
jgi:hypothetical protein